MIYFFILHRTKALTHTAACVGFAGWALAAVGVECFVGGLYFLLI